MDELDLIELDDSLPLHPKGVRELVAAIMEQGVEDVLKNYPGALDWMNGRYFDHWCAWLNIDATAARQAIMRRRGVRTIRYPEEDLRRAIALHNSGMPWRDVAMEVFHTRSANILFVLTDYNRQQIARRSTETAARRVA